MFPFKNANFYSTPRENRRLIRSLLCVNPDTGSEPLKTHKKQNYSTSESSLFVGRHGQRSAASFRGVPNERRKHRKARSQRVSGKVWGHCIISANRPIYELQPRSSHYPEAYGGRGRGRRGRRFKAMSAEKTGWDSGRKARKPESTRLGLAVRL